MYSGLFGEHVHQPVIHTYRVSRLMPFSAASGLVKVMCRASFVGCNQHASSKTTSSCSRTIPVARELASTHILKSCPVAHHRPCEGLLCVTLAIVSRIIYRSGASSVVSSHPWVTALALRFIIPVAARSHPHTARCLISFLHREKIVQRVTTSGTSGITLPRFHHKVPCSPQTSNTSTRAPSSNCSRSLLSSPNQRK